MAKVAESQCTETKGKSGKISLLADDRGDVGVVHAVDHRLAEHSRRELHREKFTANSF